MRKKLSYIGAGLLGVGFLVYLLLPSPFTLEKYERALEREQYTQVCTALGREVRRNPDNWQARQLLAEAALARGSLDLALEQIWALWAGGQSTWELENKAKTLLQDNHFTAQKADQGAALGQELLVDNPPWAWGANFHLLLLLQYDLGTKVPPALKELACKYQGATGDYEFVFQAYELMLKSCSPGEIWETSVSLEENSGDYYWRATALKQIADSEELPNLQQEYPGDALLAATVADKMEPRAGLDFLRAWGAKNVVPDCDLLAYNYVRLGLIDRAQTLQAEDLEGMSRPSLCQAALDGAPWPGKSKFVLDYLLQLGPASQEEAAIREVLGGPVPDLFYEADITYLAPNGDWLIWTEGQKSFLLNLPTNKRTPLPDTESLMVWKWAPDSTCFTGWQPFTDETSIILFDLRGSAVALPGTESYQAIGWQDEDTLWLRPRLDWLAPDWGVYQLYQVSTGKIQPSESVPTGVDLFPGPRGNLAWNHWSDEISLLRGSSEFILDCPGYRSIMSWLPDGSGLILFGEGNLDLWTGEMVEPLVAGGYFLGWKNQAQFYWGRALPSPVGEPSGYYSLHTYDLVTGETADLKIVGIFAAAAGNTVLSYNYGRYRVYLLP